MDVYEEALVKVLMPDGAPKSWNESEEFSPYIQRLASCGLGKLSSECENLKEEQASVLEQTKELAYKEYLTFIHAADCSESMVTQLGGLDQQLSHTSDSVTTLHDSLGKFVTSSRMLLASRQLNTTTLAKHTQLLEILELSQLLDTCVRNNYHDEALDIIAYVRRLEKKHGHIPIVKSIVSEVQASSQQMLSQLLAQLRTDTSLPHCLKIVGLIRTLDVFTECQLRIKFLHARDAWLTSALKAIPHHDSYHHLSKSVECARVHVFDIVTQYRSIFSDDETRFSALHDRDTALYAILQSWILHKVSGLVSMLRRDLIKGNICGSNLESLLAQCMFFGQSLSRIGADFRPLLPDIFQEAASRQLERDIRTANHKFDEILSLFSFLDAFPAMSTPQQGQSSTSSSSRPPLALLEFPPLGHYVNSLVTAFNTLRLCCFTALLPTLLNLLTTSLTKVVRSVVELHEAECVGFSVAETASFTRLCCVICDVLLPYLNTVIKSLYPLQQLAAVTGTSALLLSKKNFGQLDVVSIMEPLQQFLPIQTSVTDDISSEVAEDFVADTNTIRSEAENLETGVENLTTVVANMKPDADGIDIQKNREEHQDNKDVNVETQQDSKDGNTLQQESSSAADSANTVESSQLIKNLQEAQLPTVVEGDSAVQHSSVLSTSDRENLPSTTQQKESSTAGVPETSGEQSAAAPISHDQSHS